MPADVVGIGGAKKPRISFERVSRSLGIRSVRTGFGARSRWLWQLNSETPTPASPPPTKSVIYAALGRPPPGTPSISLIPPKALVVVDSRQSGPPSCTLQVCNCVGRSSLGSRNPITGIVCCCARAEALGENGAHYEGYSWRTGKWGARRRHMHLDGR